MKPKQATKQQLTDTAIKAIKPPRTGAAIVYDTGAPGMALRTASSGHRSFIMIARIPPSPNPTRRSLGEYAADASADERLSDDDVLALGRISLAQAREKVRLWRRMIERGLDPEIEVERRRTEQAAKQRKIAAETFEAVARRFLTEHIGGKRTEIAIRQLIETKFITVWGSRPITEIAKSDVIERIGYIKAKSGPAAARQALLYVKLLFAWATEMDIVEASPCPSMRSTGKTKLLPPKVARQRTLSDDEIRALWRATEDGAYPVAPYIRLLLILGCRRSELAAARWREFDLRTPGSEKWTLKGERTKTGDPRVIPLPAMAVAMLHDLPTFTADHVFSTSYGKKPLGSFGRLKSKLDAKITKLNGGVELESWTLHDSRRTMRTRLSALPIPPIVAELMIGHAQAGLHKIYDQHTYESEKRAGFEAWCGRLRDIVEPPPANVVKLSGARA